MKNIQQSFGRQARRRITAYLLAAAVLGSNAAYALPPPGPYGICPDSRVLVSGKQRVWRDAVTDAYIANDLNLVWWLMDSAATGSFFIYPNGGILLSNFLNRRGNVNWNYIGVWPDPSGWISDATAVIGVRDPMDEQAKDKARRFFEHGSNSGTFEIKADVVTSNDEDPDLYFAIGKFKMTGEYKYSFRRPMLGRPYVKLERVYRANDRYNWDPPRQCGIIDHIVPWTLAQAGKAADFDVNIRWGEPEFSLAIPYANCTEVRAAGKAPIYRGQPGFGAHLDGNNNGVGCE